MRHIDLFELQGGPWRLTWCRHGYDPRADQMAGRWQTIEFRAQSFELRKHLKLSTGDRDSGFKFTEGSIPPQLNCLYQARVFKYLAALHKSLIYVLFTGC
jgi:hypothetical protein